MKSVQKPIRTIVSAAIVAILAASTAQAGSFSLYGESSPAASGNYAAGIAAEAADASIGWYNPAGLALIRNQEVVFGGVGIFPSSKLTGSSTFQSASVPVPFNTFTQTFHDIQGAKSAFVPSAHYAIPLGENATFGLSIVAPFGLTTNWNRKGPVRYAATYSELITTNVSPEIGARITENVALGAGIDLQYARVKFNQMVGVPTLGQLPVPGLTPITLDSYSYNKGDSFNVGFHAGAMLMLNDNHTRVGLNYQSSIKHKFHGYSRLNGGLASPGLVSLSPTTALTATDARFWSNNLTSNQIEFPDITTLSGYQDINEQWAILGSVVFSNWNSLRSIQLNNVAGFANGFGQAKVNSITTENYRNSWRAAVGANYQVNQQWMLRVGGGYDETPTINSQRDIRIADVNRWALAAGAHYQFRPNIGVDIGYTHLFEVSDVPVNKSATVGQGNSYTVNARAKGSADLVGLQGVWLIDAVEPVVMTK